MAQYKYPKFFQQNDETIFDNLLEAGSTARVSGIYRCNGCGQETVVDVGHILPPKNHHQHTNPYLVILWQLIVTHN